MTMNAIAPLELAITAAGAGTLAGRFQAKYADRVTGALTIPASTGGLVPFPADLPESLSLALGIFRAARRPQRGSATRGIASDQPTTCGAPSGTITRTS